MAEEAGIARMKTISKYVIGTVIYMLGFITVMTVIFCFKGSVPEDERITALETDVKQIKQHIDNDNKRIKSIEAGNRITQQALLALMSHAINGNDIDKLEKARDDLQQYLIEKE